MKIALNISFSAGCYERKLRCERLCGQTNKFFCFYLMEYEPLLNVGQVAEMLGLSLATIRKWVLTGSIPYRKIGSKSVRFSAADIRDWTLNKNAAPPEGRQAQIDTTKIDGGEK
jgi:excisionase family DNA binding protein